PARGNGAGAPWKGLLSPEPAAVESLDTTYVCAVDRRGNIFSATPSDGCLSAPITPGTGLGVSSRGSQSWAVDGHASAIAPGKRRRLTPGPSIVFKNGKPFMPLGTPGGDVQCQAMLEVFLNIAVFGMEPQAAIEAPRFATYSYPGSFEPHEYRPDELRIERRLADQIGDELAVRGHRVVTWPDWTWKAGGICTITIDRARGLLAGGADPRRMGYAIGWGGGVGIDRRPAERGPILQRRPRSRGTLGAWSAQPLLSSRRFRRSTLERRLLPAPSLPLGGGSEGGRAPLRVIYARCGMTSAQNRS